MKVDYNFNSTRAYKCTLVSRGVNSEFRGSHRVCYCDFAEYLYRHVEKQKSRGSTSAATSHEAMRLRDAALSTLLQYIVPILSMRDVNTFPLTVLSVK